MSNEPWTLLLSEKKLKFNWRGLTERTKKNMENNDTSSYVFFTDIEVGFDTNIHVCTLVLHIF